MTMQRTTITFTLLAILAFGLFGHASAEPAYQLDWIQQFGTLRNDGGSGVSADGLGNVYMAGNVQGALAGPYAGSSWDTIVGKYDDVGNLLWMQQLGTRAMDKSSGVSADGLGNVYVAGTTGDDLGGPNAGGVDAFVARYDDTGNLVWTRQFGSADEDRGFGVSADGLGNVYIGGITGGSLDGPNAGESDAFVTKYDEDGNLLWTRQVGTVGRDACSHVSADGLGNVYISGYTQGDLGGPNTGEFDAFLAKYDDTGNLVWTNQFGTAVGDVANGVSADGLGNVYIGGSTRGDLDGPNAGESDAFVNKYDDAGKLLWTRQFGSSDMDEIKDVSVDGLGNVYSTGYTNGDLDGTNTGGNDAFVSKYDEAGNLLWIRQLGSIGHDGSRGVSADGLGNVYITGGTRYDLGGPNAGDYDVFVAKLSPIPEPSTLALLGMGALVLLGWIRRRR